MYREETGEKRTYNIDMYLYVCSCSHVGLFSDLGQYTWLLHVQPCCHDCVGYLARLPVWSRPG